MNKSIVVALLVSTSLAACGGGGGSSAPISASGTATSVPKVVPTQGDYYTFSYTNTPSVGSPISYSFTRAYPTVNSDGTSVRGDTYSNNFVAVTRNLDAAFGTVSLVNGTTTCTNSPSDLIIPLPATTSTIWNYFFTQTCTGGAPSTTSVNYAGSLVGFESVVTPAGTFYAGKLVFTQTSTRTGISTTQYNYSCWMDTVTGRTVKCNGAYTYVPVSGTATSGSDTFSLTGYKAAGLSSVPTVARFAGNWSGSYTGGANSGTCSTLVVSTTGSITGSCVDINVGAFTVTGSVNAAGTVNMTASTGPTFTGSLSSTTNGSGNWAGVPSGGGTWTATHQ